MRSVLTLVVPVSLALVSLTACVSKGSFDAKVVDGLTGEARTDLQVVLKAKASTDLTCTVLDGKTDAAGRVHIENTCADTEYRVSLGDDGLLVVGERTVAGGQAEAGVQELQAWRAPKNPGVYILADDAPGRVRTKTRLMSEERVMGTDVVALYPESIFKKPSMVEDGQHLLLVGTATIEKTQFRPILPDAGKRTFESGASLTGHAFVGLRFSSDEAYEVVEATLDASKLIDVGEGDRRVRYVPADALPPGQYAVWKDGDREALVLGFGTLPAPATAKADAPAE